MTMYLVDENHGTQCINFKLEFHLFENQGLLFNSKHKNAFIPFIAANEDSSCQMLAQGFRRTPQYQL